MGLFPEFGAFFIGYGSYHWNPVNKIIHIICIPLILSSLLGMLTHLPYGIPNPLVNDPVFQLNIPFFSVAAICLAYLNVDLITGLISTVFYMGHWAFNCYFYDIAVKTNQTEFHFKVAMYIHIACWILQFIGHGFFEHKAPALLDNLLYTLVAPDFVIIEVMFELGYKPDVYEKCKVQIIKNVKAFQDKRKENKVKAN